MENKSSFTCFRNFSTFDFSFGNHGILLLCYVIQFIWHNIIMNNIKDLEIEWFFFFCFLHFSVLVMVLIWSCTFVYQSILHVTLFLEIRYGYGVMKVHIMYFGIGFKQILYIFSSPRDLLTHTKLSDRPNDFLIVFGDKLLNIFCNILIFPKERKHLDCLFVLQLALKFECVQIYFCKFLGISFFFIFLLDQVVYFLTIFFAL